MASVKAVPNAPIAATAMAPDATRAGFSAGSVTSRRTRRGFAARERAASASAGSMVSTPDVTVTRTRGNEKQR